MLPANIAENATSKAAAACNNFGFDKINFDPLYATCRAVVGPTLRLDPRCERAFTKNTTISDRYERPYFARFRSQRKNGEKLSLLVCDHF